MEVSKSIIVKLREEGYHRYPSAPPEVGFLQHPHRHMFHIEAHIEVYDNDRELEFFIVQKFLKIHTMNFLIDHRIEPNNSFSCEDLAEYLVDQIGREYCKEVKRNISVSVFEDGENGARVTYHRTGE